MEIIYKQANMKSRPVLVISQVPGRSTSAERVHPVFFVSSLLDFHYEHMDITVIPPLPDQGLGRGRGSGRGWRDIVYLQLNRRTALPHIFPETSQNMHRLAPVVEQMVS